MIVSPIMSINAMSPPSVPPTIVPMGFDGVELELEFGRAGEEMTGEAVAEVAEDVREEVEMVGAELADETPEGLMRVVFPLAM